MTAKPVRLRISGLNLETMSQIARLADRRFPSVEFSVTGPGRLFPAPDQVVYDIAVSITGSAAWAALLYLIARARSKRATVQVDGNERFRMAQAFLVFEANVKNYRLSAREDFSERSHFVFTSKAEKHFVSVSNKGEITYRRKAS